LHTAQMMPLPLTVSCFRKIPIGFTFLVPAPAHLGSPRKMAVKRVCVCVFLVPAHLGNHRQSTIICVCACVCACVCRWHICGCAWRSRRLSRGVASFWSVTMATAGPAHHRYVSAWLPRSVVARRCHQQNGAGNTRHAITTVCKLEPIGT